MESHKYLYEHEEFSMENTLENVLTAFDYCYNRTQYFYKIAIHDPNQPEAYGPYGEIKHPVYIRDDFTLDVYYPHCRELLETYYNDILSGQLHDRDILLKFKNDLYHFCLSCKRYAYGRCHVDTTYVMYATFLWNMVYPFIEQYK